MKNEGVASNVRQLLASLFAFGGVLCLTLTSNCEETEAESETNATVTGEIRSNSINIDVFQENTCVGLADQINFFIPVLFAAFGAAAYKITFKKLLGTISSGQVSLFLTLIGLFSVLISFPAICYVLLTEKEAFPGNMETWTFLIASVREMLQEIMELEELSKITSIFSRHVGFSSIGLSIMACR